LKSDAALLLHVSRLFLGANHIGMNNQLQPLSGKRSSLVDASVAHLAVVDAGQLLGDAGGLVILHGSETYKLTRTKQNKLLLTKCHDKTVDVSVRRHPL
jgi:hemin uptake protein HemP